MNRRVFFTSIATVSVTSTAGCLGGVLSNEEKLPEEAPDEAWKSYEGSGGVGWLTVDGVVKLEPRQYVEQVVQAKEDSWLNGTIQVEGGQIDFNILRPDDFETWREQDYAEGVSLHPSSKTTIQDATIDTDLWPPKWHLVTYNGGNNTEEWEPVRVDLSLQVERE